MISTEIQYPSYKAIEDNILEISNKIHANNSTYDFIIGVSRGGLLPAVLLSYIINTPMIPVMYSSKIGAGNDKNHDNNIDFVLDRVKNKKIIIMDDICDSGYTLKELSDILTPVCEQVDTASLYYKIGKIYQPTYFGVHLPPNSPFIYFPWETIVTGDN